MNEESPEQLHAALLADPSDWFARRHLAERALGQGKTEYAVQLLRDAPEIPKDMKSKFLVARVFAYDDPNLALNYLDDILEINEAHPAANLWKARVLVGMNNKRFAPDYYIKAISYDPVLRDRHLEAALGITPEIQISHDDNDDVEEALSVPASVLEAMGNLHPPETDDDPDPPEDDTPKIPMPRMPK